MKLLSICIPSYNMERYLHRCVDSMLVPDVLDQLEIIIVNDGSMDSTLAIANDYKAKYSESVVVIDKPNGHYGSCINAALKIATGKYFRIVDADDWVDSDALVEVVHKMEETDADVVFTRFSKYLEETKSTVDSPLPADVTWNVKKSLNDVRLDFGYRHMHALSYRLQFLKDINYVQTEGICYTDSQYVYMPLVNAQTIYCINRSLYQYYIGRDDQTVAPEQIKKNFSHFHKTLLSIYNYPKPAITNNNYNYLRAAYFNVKLGYMLNGALNSGRLQKDKDRILRDTISTMLNDGEDLSIFWDRKIRIRFTSVQLKF